MNMVKEQEQPPPYQPETNPPVTQPPQSYGQSQGYGPPQGNEQSQGYGQPQSYEQPQGYGQPHGYGPPQGNEQPMGHGHPQMYGQPLGYGHPQGYGQPQQSTVFVTSPPAGTVYVRQRPQNYLVASILVCLCCFWPTGVCAIFVANRANAAADNGDYALATKKARSARNLIIASIIAGIICYVIIVVLRVTQYSSYNRY